MKSLKVGCVPYLNSKPFLAGFDEEKITFLPPSKLAPALRSGNLDIAIVPIFECLQYPHYKILDRLSIACVGPVKSVILLHDRPIPEIRTISADSDSLTSIHLLKVLLQQHWKISPRILPEGEKADGMLWIGDRALRYSHERRDLSCTDLGQAWMDFTGLPFVFAIWGISPRSNAGMQELDSFRDLCLKSIKQRHRIATCAEDLEYFTRYIKYDLGASGKEAIGRFRQECFACGFISNVEPSLVYV